VELEKGDTALLELTRKALQKAKIGFEETAGVHAGTLKSFVKELLADGTKPPESITYHQQPTVVLKAAKAPRVSKGKSALV
jgi:hypothetical protein